MKNLNILRKEMFEHLVNEALFLNDLIRLSVDVEIKSGNMDRIQFAMSFCTVEVNLGRDTGKTRYILNHMNKKDIAFFTRKFDIPRTHPYSYTKQDVVSDNIRGMRWKLPDYIFVDNASIFFADIDKYNFYRTILSNIDNLPTFVLLG